ncbi:UvrD-helicase domain-containing protein [Cysteiniphilum halobium]|uniref:UvrD-helicase domain-containing protein n=1 Tax=Cysteiniphilum halobium TaxID=2219059 RepID=UPI003F83852F
MTPNDAAARNEALNPKKSFIVQAPAGSGKTETLTQRYLNLLSHVEAPEEIIALTFTNKAANEMQQRIYQSLLAAQTAHEPKEPHKKLTFHLAQQALLQNTRKQWQLLMSPKRLRIMTIDAFCQSLSKQLIFETDEAFSAEISDTPELLYEQAIDDFINDTHKQSPLYQDLHDLLAHLDNDINRVKDLLSSMLARREQWLSILLASELTQADTTHGKVVIESGFKALFTELQQRLSTLLNIDQNQFILNEILIFCDNKNNENKENLIDQDNPIFWQKLINLLFTNDNTFRKTFNARQGLPAKDAKAKSYAQWLIDYTQSFSDNSLLDITSLVAEIRLYERLLLDDQEWQILSAIARIALRLVQYLKLVFKARALLDFNEVSLQALSALGSSEAPTDLMLYLDHQIKHLLIDEFQDTSILQFKLLQMLTLEWQADDGKTLFIVGDPMQSIYRFRQAEVNQFLDVKAHGINQVPLTFLQFDCNFRSQKTIVDWVNNHFCTIFPKEDDRNYGGISYAPATTLSQELSQEAITYQLFANLAQEAQFIADSIKTYLDQYPDHQIAILVRTRSHLKHLVPVLKAQGVAVVENEIETFYHQPMVMDLLCLCAILNNPEQSIYWVSLLQSPLFGFSLNELQNVEQLQLNEQQNEKPYSFYAKLSFYLKKQQTHPHQQKAFYFLSWINHTFFNGVRSPLLRRLRITWQALDGFSIYPNHVLFTSFIDLLHNHLTQDKTAIAQFDRFVMRLKRKFVSSPSQSNVLIMTMHKSKGLEFDFVILPQLDKRGKADDTPLFLHDTVRLSDGKDHLLLSPIKHSWEKETPALFKVIQSMQKKRGEYELQRLLYVAVTRAKSKLLFTAVNENGNEIKAANNSFLALLAPLNLPWVTYEDRNTNISPVSADQEPKPYYKVIKQIQNYSTTAVPNFEHYQAALEADTADDLNQPDLSELVLSSDRQIGLALHQLFNYLSTSSDNINHWQNYFSICLHQHAIARPHHAEAYTLANEAVTNTLKQFPWILNAHGMHEQVMLNLSFDKTQKHIADRIIIDNNRYHIIDYKFASPNNNEPLAEFVAQQTNIYHTQLINYQKLIARYFKLNSNDIKLSLYFPLIPHLQAL